MFLMLMALSIFFLLISFGSRFNFNPIWRIYNRGLRRETTMAGGGGELGIGGGA